MRLEGEDKSKQVIFGAYKQFRKSGISILVR